MRHQGRLGRRARGVHTLEAILHTSLEIREHTTDTHGATEHVFALFDLLGQRFIPRLRDAGELRLHRLRPPAALPVDAVLRARARRERYDELLRAAASLKRGWVPASLLLTRLKNGSPQTPLAAALAEHGRIVRTNFCSATALTPWCAPASAVRSIRANAALPAPPRHRLPRPAAR